MNSVTSIAEFTAPSVTQETPFTFQLTVTDNSGASSSDTVVVTISPVLAANQLPVASVPADFNANENTVVTLDGSASNDGSNMWEEVRRAYLLNHLKYGTEGLTAYNILKIATRGGAEVLGRTDTGYLAEGMAADLNLFDLSGIEYAGCHDPLVSLVGLGNHSYTKMTIVNGKVVSKDGIIQTINTEKIAKEAHKHATELVAKQRKA